MQNRTLTDPRVIGKLELIKMADSRDKKLEVLDTLLVVIQVDGFHSPLSTLGFLAAD
jgi:hypothetical protein